MTRVKAAELWTPSKLRTWDELDLTMAAVLDMADGSYRFEDEDIGAELMAVAERLPIRCQEQPQRNASIYPRVLVRVRELVEANPARC